MKKIIVITVFAFFISSAFAETVVLKSGKSIEGKIIEDTADYIKLETPDGQNLYFYKNTIKDIAGENQGSGLATAGSSVSFKTGLVDRLNEGYMLYVAKDINQNSPSPILFCLPGSGISAKQDINNWAFYAAKQGFIVVGLDINYDLIRSEGDVGQLYSRMLRIIENVAEEYPVQKNRIFIVGTSAGGMMSIALGLHYPDEFSAIGVVSGGRLGFGAEQDIRNARGLWIYMIHGQQDKRIPVSEFFSTRSQLEKNGAIIESKVIPAGEHTLSFSCYKETIDWLSKVK